MTLLREGGAGRRGCSGGIERRRTLCNFVSVLIVDEENEQKERGEKGLQGRVEKGEGAYAIRSCGS